MTDFFLKLGVLRVMLLVAFDDWRGNVWAKDLDVPICCSRRGCCCGGETLRDVYGKRG